MTSQDFSESVSQLQGLIVSTIQAFFETRGLPFDSNSFDVHGSQDVKQMAQEAHFYGADVYPTELCPAIAA